VINNYELKITNYETWNTETQRHGGKYFSVSSGLCVERWNIAPCGTWLRDSLTCTHESFAASRWKKISMAMEILLHRDEKFLPSR
jgi:hypothetical protein